jgi:ligand-binding sensor domain-containing protein
MLLVRKQYKISRSVLILIILFLNLQLPAQSKNTAPTQFPEPKFEHITMEDGLPENTVSCILQDHLGYLWLGTQKGLVKYDGYTMTVYQANHDDSLSISGPTVWSIYEDSSGTLWIGTDGGLNRFDRKTETFTHYSHNPDDSTSINSNSINSMYEDKAGNFWVGTIKGLNLFDRQNESFEQIYYQDSVKSILLNYMVGPIIEDRLTENLYVGSGNRLLILNREKKFLAEIYNNVELEYDFGEIQSFYQSNDTLIWIGHLMGLSKFNPQSESIKFYQPISSATYIPEYIVSQSIEDANGLIWTTSYNVGLVSFNP